MPMYDIRAEFKDNRYLDFKVGGESLEQIKPKAEAEIRERKNLPFETKFDWRGAVVFVDHSPSA